MGVMSTVISAIESQISSLGYSRSSVNITADSVPSGAAHKDYAFSRFSDTPKYLADNYADLELSYLDLNFLWKVTGTHNASGTLHEGFLDLLDERELLENELVGNQSQSNGEEISIHSTEITAVTGEDTNEYLVLAVVLRIDITRAL